MPEFDYTARELSGKQIAGTLTATTEQDALSILAGRQLYPQKVVQSEASRRHADTGTRRVPVRSLTTFFNQLADLLRSGVPLLRSLQLLSDQTSSPALKYVIQDVCEQVADGARLNDSMRRHSKAFSQLTISMVRAGEEGGFLEDVLSRVATFNDHQEELRSRVVSAMVYPLFLAGAGGMIISVLLLWFVPEFGTIFDQMRKRGELPWATTTLMSLSDAIRHWWFFVAMAVGSVAGGIWYFFFETEAGRLKLDHFKLKTPGLGGIVQDLAVARFCRMLGTLLRNGVPMLQSLGIARDASGNQVLSTAIGKAAENVSGGKSLATPLKASGQFRREIVEMISVGEEANNLENVLLNIADNLERYTSRRIDVVVRMLEPVMLLVMAAIVTFVIAALLLPVLNMSSAF
ncbi:MAG: type II secretion system F family protein [Fuerstiella sp.]|nr:type II secretion system F family protein [Fuerstiella sp.]